VKHLSVKAASLTVRHNLAEGQCLVGSLTGAVSC